MKRVITPLLSIIIAVLVIVFVTKPKYEEVKLVRTETDEYRVAAEKYAIYNAKIQELLLVRDSVNLKDKERLDTLAPAELDITRLLVDIENMAVRSNMNVENVDVLDKIHSSAGANGRKAEGVIPSSDEVQFAEVSLSLTGTYLNFKNFLTSVETSLTLMEVTKMTVDQKEGNEYSFKVTVRTYALPTDN
jgi:Tfp pilus assembly protein PilO